MSGVITTMQRSAPRRIVAPVVPLLPAIPDDMSSTTGCVNPWDLTGFTTTIPRHLGSRPT